MGEAASPAPVAVRFHRSLYPTASVERAAARFAAFGPTVAEHPADVLVTFSAVPERLAARLPDEFRNHALFQVIVDTRQAEGPR